MSDYESDGYEIENDEEFEQHMLDKEGSRKYRMYLRNRDPTYRYKSELEDKRILEPNKEVQTDDFKIIMNMYSDDDMDQGMLSDVGGYFQVVKVSKNSISLRRTIVNSIVGRFLLKKDKKISEGLDNSSFERANVFLNLNQKAIIPRDETWKDFKMFITQKYMTLPSYKIQTIYNNSLKDEFNTSYIEFLISKSRFIYHNLSADESLKNFEKLVSSSNPDSFGKTDDLKEGSIYKLGFYQKLKTVRRLRTVEHNSAFFNFSRLGMLPYNGSYWQDKETNCYSEFLANSHSISVLEVDKKYDISYISKKNDRSQKFDKHLLFKDDVLNVLKKMFSSLAVEFCEQCKSWKSISAIKRNMRLDTGLIDRFLDSSGCNYMTFESNDVRTMLVQTTLNNVFLFQTPIDIFQQNCYYLNKDISFCRLKFEKHFPQNNITEHLKQYQRKMFDNGIDEVTYDSFLLNYYARLSNIPEDDIEAWMSKNRRLKSKIFQSSSYCRTIAAKAIQRAVRSWKLQGKFFKLNLINVLEKKKKKVKKLIQQSDDEVFKHYIEDNAALKITNFFKKIPLIKECKFYIELLRNLKLNKQNEPSFEKFSRIEIKNFHAKLRQKESTRIQKNRIFETNNKIRFSKTYNTSKYWFGFQRNTSLNNLIISSGFDVSILEEKDTYTRSEFITLLKCISEICSCTGSKQFVKLCRSMSGYKHKGKTIEDFIKGFCWVFDKITKYNFMTMVGMFCKATKNNKFMVYVANNLDKIAQNEKLIIN